ncbi:unnamed protein product [Rotaria sp. Silwood2]|nr:unnamed protein product [Rotaria sp. Silwood2]CAF4509153.1 unnamed protein product [Rotaria sp. Silwood2]
MMSKVTSTDIVLSHIYINVTFLMIYGTMWAFDMKFDAGFFTLSYVLLSYTRQSCVNFFNFAIRDLLHYMAAQKRIRVFLLLDESERDNRLLSTSIKDILEINKIDDNSINRTSEVICNLKPAQWEQNGKFSLKNIIFNAHPGDLMCIIGPVGSGKSSLLQTLTGEITYFEGKVRLYGSFCYVPQESSRVNLARALYHDADIYLLDDPLSAVDAKVAKHLFEKSIKEYLRDKICILVTHQIQFLQDSTTIIVLDNGEMIQIGTKEELIVSSPIFAQLLVDINQHEQGQPSDSFSNQQSIVKPINSEKEDPDEEDNSLLPKSLETKQQGTMNWNVYISYLRAGIGLL